jgi:hypothetical protein
VACGGEARCRGRRGRGANRRKKEGEEKEEGKRKRRKIEKGYRKLGKILGKFGGKEKRDFAWFSGFGGLRDFGTAVMARRTGRRDRDVRRIPGAVADNGARAAGGGATA